MDSSPAAPLTLAQRRPIRANPATLDVTDHPVFQALGPAAQEAILAGGGLVRLKGWDPLDQDHLWFVLHGALGVFSSPLEVCVSMIAAGSVHGWEHALFLSQKGPSARPLVDVLAYRVPASLATEALGRDWLTRFVALQAARRLRALEVEAACNASHLVSERLAKWLVRLHASVNGVPLQITQAELARMLGAQRTSINAAAARLQASGCVRFSRGAVHLLDVQGLRALSCGCVDAGDVLEQRPRRPADEPASWLPQPTSPAAAPLPHG